MAWGGSLGRWVRRDEDAGSADGVLPEGRAVGRANAGPGVERCSLYRPAATGSSDA